eukprot:m.9247 g.9247  ORF g.9247 m.9247 type:complete len:771 (+) comp5436_c0_seq2:192-2504(+)
MGKKGRTQAAKPAPKGKRKKAKRKVDTAADFEPGTLVNFRDHTPVEKKIKRTLREEMSFRQKQREDVERKKREEEEREAQDIAAIPESDPEDEVESAYSTLTSLLGCQQGKPEEDSDPDSEGESDGADDNGSNVVREIPASSDEGEDGEEDEEGEDEDEDEGEGEGDGEGELEREDDGSEGHVTALGFVERLKKGECIDDARILRQRDSVDMRRYDAHFQSLMDADDMEELKLAGQLAGSTSVGDQELEALVDDYMIQRVEAPLPDMSVPKLTAAAGKDAPPTMRERLHPRIACAESYSPFEETLFDQLDTYSDLMFTAWSFSNRKEIERAYMQHALNHVLKSKAYVLRHNDLLEHVSKLPDAADLPELEFRDQGYTRPRALILVPYRNNALRLVKLMEALLVNRSRDKAEQLKHKQKFTREFSEEDPEFPHPNPEHRQFFEGNIDDCFCLGITISKFAVGLYSDLYASDLIIASPLGLRRIIGAEGDASRDFDFLSSIDLTILDQADVFHMQNFLHVSHVFNHLNLSPEKPRDADISRIRHACIEGIASHLRQTIIFTATGTPQQHALFSRACTNVSGKALVTRPTLGTIQQVAHKISQVFHRLPCESHSEASDVRFEHFMQHIKPLLSSNLRSHVLVFIPSYFDFVRVRNALKKDEVKFAQICEYTKNTNVSRARSYFFHGQRRFMLYTERYHYHQRPTLRNIKHIVFYQLPQYPQFYSELLNLIPDASDATCTALFTKYDAESLCRVVGASRGAKMLVSEKDTYMFV